MRSGVGAGMQAGELAVGAEGSADSCGSDVSGLKPKQPGERSRARVLQLGAAAPPRLPGSPGRSCSSWAVALPRQAPRLRLLPCNCCLVSVRSRHGGPGKRGLRRPRQRQRTRKRIGTPGADQGAAGQPVRCLHVENERTPRRRAGCLHGSDRPGNKRLRVVARDCR